MPHCQSDSHLLIQQVCVFTHALSSSLHCTSKPVPSISMSGWLADVADAVEEHEAATAPPQSKASMPRVCQDDAPTEPATSPRVMEVPSPRYVEELRLPTREYGPHEEPERFVTKWVARDGYTQEEWEAYFRKHRQAWSNQEWEARVQASELHYPSIPRGPTPAGTSSMRALPDVHEALRQNDPKMASHSQPVVKKAPPSIGRPRPSVF